MIELAGHIVPIPHSWDELSLDEFSGVCDALFSYFFDHRDDNQLKLDVFKSVFDYQRGTSELSQDEIERINLNIILIANHINFYRKPKYEDPEQLSVFPEHIQKMLLEKFPEDITDPEIKRQIQPIIPLLNYSSAFNLSIKQPPLKSLVFEGKKPVALYYSIDKSGLLETNMVAEQFVDAQDFFNQFHRTGDKKYLNNLATTLFFHPGNQYNSLIAQAKASTFENESILPIAYILFRSLYEFVSRESVYQILFKSVDDGPRKLTLGPSGTLYDLAKAGYGNVNHIKKLPLADYLNLLLKQLIDSVHQLRAYKKTNLEIAKDLHLDLETVTQL